MAWGCSVRKDYRWWRSWAKERRLDPDATENAQSPKDLLRWRVAAQRRAAAAEHVAKEANAARLKALLDAARDEADRKTIEVAEQRFDEAKGEWEAVRDAFLEERDRQVREQHVMTPVAAAAEQSAVAGGGWLTRITDGSPQRIVTLGVLAALIFGVVAGAAGYLLFNDTVGSSKPGPKVDLRQTPRQAAEAIGTGKAETEPYRPAGSPAEPSERVSSDTTSQQAADLPPSAQSANPSAAIKRTAKTVAKSEAEAAEVAKADEEPKPDLWSPFLPEPPPPARGEADDPAAPFNNASGEEAE